MLPSVLPMNLPKGWPVSQGDIVTHTSVVVKPGNVTIECPGPYHVPSNQVVVTFREQIEDGYKVFFLITTNILTLNF